MGLNEDVDAMAEWLTEEQITDILLWRMAAEEEGWHVNSCETQPRPAVKTEDVIIRI